MATNIYTVDGSVGIDLKSIYTAAQMSPGLVLQTNQGPVQFVTVGVGGAATGQLLQLDASATTDVVTGTIATTTTSGSTVNNFGIALNTVTAVAGDCVWVARGEFTAVDVLTTTGITEGTALTTHTVAGTVSTGGDTIPGLTTNATSTAGLTSCRAAFGLSTNT